MAHPVIDVNLSSNLPQELLFEKHVAFLKALEKKEDPMLDYMKLSAIYWSLTALDLMKKLDVIDKDNVLNFVKSCKNADGGIAPAPGHDSHLLSTLSGIQILAMYDELQEIDRDVVLHYISSLQVCLFIHVVLSFPHRTRMVVSMEINGAKLIPDSAFAQSQHSLFWALFPMETVIFLSPSKESIYKRL